jgi:uncharacterized protein
MSSNKQTVETYQMALGNLDWATVASCLTDEVERVEWADGFATSGVPVRGKSAVLKDMETPNKFEIHARRMTEEDNIVVAECVVRVPLKDGGFFTGECLSLYELEDGKIKRMSSFVAENKHPA